MVGRHKGLQVVCLFLCIVALPCWAQSGAADEWERQISVQLESHKHFPLEACGKSGEAKVAFTIDRKGKLISTSIESGTGVPTLDEAAPEIIRSAQPFPPAPANVADQDRKFSKLVIFHKSPPGTPSCESIRETIRSEDRLRGRMRGICRGC
jgi:TonB family protein